MIDFKTIKATDPEMYEVYCEELKRQRQNIELIASENFVSPAVMAAMGSHLTNKYAEGYPGKRYYGGCYAVDKAEELARQRACELFGAKFANVQPHSGASANLAAFVAFLQPGDTVLSMNLAHGGHLSHGSPVNISGKYFNIVPYGVSESDCRIDYDEVGAVLMVDMAHIAGLVAAGLHPSPIPYADVVTTTTHKTLRGPRGGMILCNDEQVFKKINSAVFPGTQGGPLMHVIAAKAVCFAEALKPEFKAYQQQVINNARVLADTLMKHGVKLVSGGTDNHLMLVDLSNEGITGKELEKLLDDVHITANKNGIPFDTQKPTITSGLRLGTPSVTSRGMKEEEMVVIGELIADIIKNKEEALERSNEKVLKLTERFPLYANDIIDD